MWLARLLVGLMLAPNVVTATAQVTPKESAVTLYGGYRDGGSFIDANSNQTLRLDGSSAWAISYDKGLDRSYQLQFYVSYQSTHSNTTPAPLPMKVIYFHLGITYFFDGPIGQGPYFVCGIGATRFHPGSSRYGDEVQPSLNLGIGYQAALGEHFALRVETRGYVTGFNSSAGWYCSGACGIQGDVQLGLSYRF